MFNMWPVAKHQEPKPTPTAPAPAPQPQKPRPDMASLRQWFAKVDRDASGHITAMELQAALADGGLNFSVGTVAAIIRQCDSSGSGTISLADFERLHSFLETVQDTFNQMGPDPRTGRVPLGEVARELAASGYHLEPEVQKALFTKFDPLRANSMGLQEFMALTLFLRSSTATFKAYDPEGSGVVHLTYGQFLYAAVNSI